VPLQSHSRAFVDYILGQWTKKAVALTTARVFFINLPVTTGRMFTAA
jgi:hypothetical protein